LGGAALQRCDYSFLSGTIRRGASRAFLLPKGRMVWQNLRFRMKQHLEPRRRKPTYRFGIGEWYGKTFTKLSAIERRDNAEQQFTNNPPDRQCPFLSDQGHDVACWKKGGVCSLRLYEKTPEGEVRLAPTRATLRATCPSRFEQDRTIYGWIGEVVLGSNAAVSIGQVNFLERMPLIGDDPDESQQPEAVEEVGRIDNVLIVPGSDPLSWCPVEIQAVYFSGRKMELEFANIRAYDGEGLPFPVAHRRPDYRSSGPKRLMPQLLVKVPTLRRWGKKMAVVVDEDFFAALGRMEAVPDISNCDVAWFVVKFVDGAGGAILERKNVFLTTLESSQSGLVAGRPIRKEEFEQRIRARLPAS